MRRTFVWGQLWVRLLFQQQVQDLKLELTQFRIDLEKNQEKNQKNNLMMTMMIGMKTKAGKIGSSLF